ncbi:MAG TPA: large-conductance mechanosensitive channel protein MscL [Chitinophagaceae bacterium]|jgi:large conductance mechanosensitive channel|nr:large-conductance mechanosensitive channel protein MscL [Chitinophagaceae bacterium]
MSFIKEFKEFALKGNLVDLAVAVVMGGAFGKVVTSFIDGMVMPAIGMLTGGTDFNDKKIMLKAGTDAIKNADGTTVAAVPEVAIKWGSFVTVAIEFAIVALVVFVIIKALNKMKKKEAEAPAAPSSTDVLLMEIRDSLKK